MKITSVTPILLSAPYGAPDDAELKKSYPLGKRSAAFVIVETDEGLTGLGETYAGVFVPELVVQLVNYLGDRLAGSDPFEIAELHRRMTRATSYWGHGGFWAASADASRHCAPQSPPGSRAFATPSPPRRVRRPKCMRLSPPARG